MGCWVGIWMPTGIGDWNSGCLYLWFLAVRGSGSGGRFLIVVLDSTHLKYNTNVKIESTYISESCLLYPKLLFGNKLESSGYTSISEAEIYLGNDLLIDTKWDKIDIQSQQRHFLHRE